MCRHAAYLGPTRTLAEVLTDPPHGLCEQSFEPRLQAHGRVNADGFGIGWWTGADGPARYRRAVPIWADANLETLARRLRGEAMLGSVRDATAGSVLEETAVAPYATAGMLFSHNGVVQDWRRLPGEIATGLPDAGLSRLEALSDSALVWAMIAARVEAGRKIDAAVEAVIAQIAAVRPEARLNLLVMDRHTIVASRWGDSLAFRRGDGWVQVASEPTDDVHGWEEVPRHHLVLATREGAAVRPLPTGPDRAE